MARNSGAYHNALELTKQNFYLSVCITSYGKTQWCFCQPNNDSQVLTAFQYHVALAGYHHFTHLHNTLRKIFHSSWFTDEETEAEKSWCGLLSSHSLWVPIPHALFFTTALHCGSPRSLDRLDTPSLAFVSTDLAMSMFKYWMYVQAEENLSPKSLILYLALRIMLVAVVFLLVTQTCSDCKRLEGSKEEIFLRYK